MIQLKRCWDEKEVVGCLPLNNTTATYAVAPRIYQTDIFFFFCDGSTKEEEYSRGKGYI